MKLRRLHRDFAPEGFDSGSYDEWYWDIHGLVGRMEFAGGKGYPKVLVEFKLQRKKDAVSTDVYAEQV